MVGVDNAEGAYLVAKKMRENAGKARCEYTRQQLLDALYLGAASLRLDAYYDPLWSAMQDLIEANRQ